LFAAVVILAALAAFAPALPNEPIGDDTFLLQTRLDSSDLISFFRESYVGGTEHEGLYRPLSLAFLRAQKLAFGTNPVAFRIVNLALHAFCSVIVFVILLRRCSAWPWPQPVNEWAKNSAALFGSLVFATHPIHAEAVATIYGQADLWASAFFLLASLVFVEGRLPLLVYILYFLRLMCKEQGVLLPVFLILLRGRMQRSDAAWALPLGAYLLLRLNALGTDALPLGASTVALGYPWWARINLFVVTVATYVRLLVLPWGQTTYYGHLRESLFGLPVVELAILSITAVAAWLLSRSRIRGVFIIAATLFVCTLLPVANVLPIGTVVGERCLYLPSVALCLLCSAAFACVPMRAAGKTALMCGIALVGIAASWRVVFQWRTPLSHWKNTVESHPNSPRAQAMYGLLLLREASGERDPKFVEAERAVELALIMNPRSTEAWHGKGLLSVLRGDCAAATIALTRALDLRPGDAEIERTLRRCR
jgi:hypothetical protein